VGRIAEEEEKNQGERRAALAHLSTAARLVDHIKRRGDPREKGTAKRARHPIKICYIP